MAKEMVSLGLKNCCNNRVIDIIYQNHNDVCVTSFMNGKLSIPTIAAGDISFNKDEITESDLCVIISNAISPKVYVVENTMRIKIISSTPAEAVSDLLSSEEIRNKFINDVLDRTTSAQ